MVIISRPPTLSASDLQVFHTTDPSLSNAPFVILYGPSATSTTAPASSARIQCHIFSSAGLQSYLRLAISPGTPLYAAVNCLPREEQGDEILRALAYTLFKYFGELPEIAKDEWIQQSLTVSGPNDALKLFGASHAASLASRMTNVEHPSKVIAEIEQALSAQAISHLEVDVVLPPGSIREIKHPSDSATEDPSLEDDDNTRYGGYAPLVGLFGDTLFIPTSKVQRAPSRPLAINRSITFAKKQKENLRREMNELIDTEENYLEKLEELVGIAHDFRSKARLRPPHSSSPDEVALVGLFPPSLDTIAGLNAEMLQAMQRVADGTEERAIRDIESTPDSSVPMGNHQAIDDSDATGILALVDALLEHLPRLRGVYGAYIQAQPNFGPLVKEFTKDGTSSMTQRIHETGEQRLMSLLIEPVQRLPRYSLYLDNISKQLPIRHPALKKLMLAKDVVSQICDQGSNTDVSSKLARLRSLIPSWPSTLQPPGRFISAVDASEVGPHLDPNRNDPRAVNLLMLLFAGQIIFARKYSESALSARSFLAEIEKPISSMPGSTSDSGLLYIGSKQLSDLNFSHTEDGNHIRMSPVRPAVTRAMTSPDDERIRQFRLTGPNEGRANRWFAEILKARLEGRFSEGEREGAFWEARSCENNRLDLGLYSAVFAEGEQDRNMSRRRPAATRVVLDANKGAKRLTPGTSGVEIVASVSDEGQGFFKLDIEAINERATRDRVTATEFLPVLIKRLTNLLQMRHQIRNPILTVYLLQHYAEVLKSLSIANHPQDNGTIRSRHKRPASPTKLFANLFGSTSLKDHSTKENQPSRSVFDNVPRLAPPQRSKSFTSREPAHLEKQPSSKTTLVGTSKQVSHTDPFQNLERTLSCYLLALQARKGNIIGAVVSRRSMADESTVNQLHNALLEGTEAHEQAAQASVDVLMAAFETFVKLAWRDTLGPIIGKQTLVALQLKMETLNAFDYDEFEERKLADLAPQNRRALVAIIGTLSELLEGMWNDGDRGALTAAFTEIVVCDADPHEFMALFDRFVDNQDTLSDRPISSGVPSAPGSVSSTLTGTTKNGSISSKASSFSKRLGFGSLRRENSKRTQKALPPDPPVAKPSLFRSHSHDLDSQVVSLRPDSREQPDLVGAREGSRPGTARSDHSEGPPSVVVSPIKRSGATKKKRRSSLSDLPNLESPSASPFWTNSATKKVDGIFNGSSNLVTPSRLEPGGTPSKSASVRNTSPSRKENTPPLAQRSQTVRESSPLRSMQASTNRLPEPSRLADVFSSRNDGASFIERSPIKSQRAPLSERVASGNTPPPLNLSPSKLPSTATSPTKSKRPYTGAKLDERIHSQQVAIDSTSSTLQDELAKIGKEMNELHLSRSNSVSPSKPSSRSTSGNEQTLQMTNLMNRLRALETKVTHLTTNLSGNNTTLKEDVASSLGAAERKAKAVERELKQAHAENDVLYSRMNEELMKVFEQVRKGDGVEEMRKQMKEQMSEAEKWKREVNKLRRENATLKSLVG